MAALIWIATAGRATRRPELKDPDSEAADALHDVLAAEDSERAPAVEEFLDAVNALDLGAAAAVSALEERFK